MRIPKTSGVCLDLTWLIVCTHLYRRHDGGKHSIAITITKRDSDMVDADERKHSVAMVTINTTEVKPSSNLIVTFCLNKLSCTGSCFY